MPSELHIQVSLQGSCPVNSVIGLPTILTHLGPPNLLWQGKEDMKVHARTLQYFCHFYSHVIGQSRLCIWVYPFISRTGSVIISIAQRKRRNRKAGGTLYHNPIFWYGELWSRNRFWRKEFRFRYAIWGACEIIKYLYQVGRWLFEEEGRKEWRKRGKEVERKGRGKGGKFGFVYIFKIYVWDRMRLHKDSVYRKTRMKKQALY